MQTEPARGKTERKAHKALGGRLRYLFFTILVRSKLVFLAKILMHLVVAWYCCVPSVRKRAYPYLGRRFPGQGAFCRFWHVYRLYLQLGQNILAGIQAGITRRFPVSSCTIPGCQASQNDGSGIIVLSAHFGGWQLGLAGLERLGRKVSVVQVPSQGEQNRHYYGYSGGRDFAVIDATDPVGAMLAATTALARGEIVCIMADRPDFEKKPEKSLAVPFLGGKIRLPAGPFAMASMTGARLMVLLTVWKNGQVCLLEAKDLKIPANLPRRKTDAFEPYMQAYAKCLEQAVIQYPYQYYCFYDLWE